MFYNLVRDTSQYRATIHSVTVISELHVTCTMETPKNNQLFRNGEKKGKSGEVLPEVVSGTSETLNAQILF